MKDLARHAIGLTQDIVEEMARGDRPAGETDLQMLRNLRLAIDALLRDDELENDPVRKLKKMTDFLKQESRSSRTIHAYEYKQGLEALREAAQHLHNKVYHI